MTAPTPTDDYTPQFPELEDKVHNIIEDMHQHLPLAIDKLVEAYDETVAQLRTEVAELKAQLNKG